MSDFRIVDDNFPFRSDTGITASTEDVNFPASNIKEFIRSKLWRSNASGQFIIDSTNNKINFKESGAGPELTATISAGTYAATTLQTEIKSKMESAGAETYTVSKSLTTGKWTISTSGAFLSLLWSSGTDTGATIGGVLGFDTGADSTGATSYTGPKIAIHTEESVLIDIKTKDPIDTFALVFDAFEGIKFTSSAVVKLQASATPGFGSPAVDETLTFDEENQIAVKFFTTDQEYRFWRILIIDPENPNLRVELSKIILGKKITLSDNPQLGFIYLIEDRSNTRRTRFGHEYSDIYPTRKQFEFDFSSVEDPDIEAIANSFNRVGNTQVVFLVADAQETLFNAERFNVYGKYVGQLETAHVFRDIFNYALSIRETF